MKVYSLDCELLVPALIRETFAFFEDPANLAEITPDWMGFEIVTTDLEMRAGLQIDYRFRWLGLPMKWKTLISVYQPPFLFVDEAVKSPYTLWRHRHEFLPAEGGTLVRDHVHYSLPFGPLGQIANSAIVSRQLQEIFRYRQSRILNKFTAPVS